MIHTIIGGLEIDPNWCLILQKFYNGKLSPHRLSHMKLFSLISKENLFSFGF